MDSNKVIYSMFRDKWQYMSNEQFLENCFPFSLHDTTVHTLLNSLRERFANELYVKHATADRIDRDTIRKNLPFDMPNSEFDLLCDAELFMLRARSLMHA